MMVRGRDPYSRSSFAAKREHARRLCGIAQEPLYECRLCRGAGLPVRMMKRDRRGHLERMHAGQEQGRTIRMLFAKVKRGER